MAAMSLLAVGYLVLAATRGVQAKPPRVACDTPALGYECWPSVSHFWGQYSPAFSVPSEVNAAVPLGCEITFVQVLSRHGARNPTSGKTAKYAKLISEIHSSVTSYGPGYEFIKDYTYSLGADDLTVFGQQEMVDSGIQFYERYQALARSETPFVRAAGEDRVVESAQNWTQGLHQARAADRWSTGPDSFPYGILAIPEADGVNNTLSHGLCTNFENGPDGGAAQAVFLATFAPAITARLNANLPGANLTDTDTTYMMDMCSFDTVASVNGSTLSPFCDLFTEAEWRDYDYYETLGKYYGYGPGNALGPTQGVGWANELIARLTGKPVVDHTSTNSTLDGDPATFPLGRRLYADFSHDNDMTGIFAALGLLAGTPPLSNTTRSDPRANGGYASSWTVPFGSRAYFEKMTCGARGAPRGEELVRVLLNGRVVPLQGCMADSLGRCGLDDFVASLKFAKSGGKWDLCFA